MSSEPTIEDPAAETDVELSYLYDDPSNPTELTIFSPEDRKMATEWMTVDRASAVSLTQIR